MKMLFISLLLFFFSITASAVEKIEVQGLFSNKAVISVDGKRHIITVGQTSPEGIKLISADSYGATLEVDGQQKLYNLGSISSINTTFSKRKKRQEKIYVNSAGMYLTIGSINGYSVRFLIDTGASAISMNTDQAKQLAIDYEKIGIPATVTTASEFTKAFRVHLKTVSVGSITQTNVEAFIIDGNHPGPILLGMTFLGRIGVERSGNAMTLTQE